MRDPGELYDLSVEVAQVPLGLHLVAGLTGFADAGSAVSQFSQYLLDTLDVREIATFDADALLDYRARRPTIFFDQDHLTEYTPLKLSLYLVKDELGQPFLLLTGFEPDFQWERFTEAVLQLVNKYKVKDTTWVHAIPMPVPHTRPIGVTRPDRLALGVEASDASARQRAAPSRVPAVRAGASDRGIRAAGSSLPRGHRIPAGRGRRAREHQRRDGAHLPDRAVA